MAKKKQNEIVHPKHRWFIWTLVAIVVVGVALASYINITTIKDQAEFNASFNPKPVAPPNF